MKKGYFGEFGGCFVPELLMPPLQELEEAMRDIMMIYGGLRRPILVLFLTDGRLQSDWEIEEILIKTSRFT